jgi:hypothetical protein
LTPKKRAKKARTLYVEQSFVESKTEVLGRHGSKCRNLEDFIPYLDQLCDLYTLQPILIHNFAAVTEESIGCGGHYDLLEVKPMLPK